MWLRCWGSLLEKVGEKGVSSRLGIRALTLESETCISCRGEVWL